MFSSLTSQKPHQENARTTFVLVYDQLVKTNQTLPTFFILRKKRDDEAVNSRFHQKIMKRGQQLASRFYSRHASTLLKCPRAGLEIPARCSVVDLSFLCRGSGFLFRDQYSNIYICLTFLTWWALLIIKRGVKSEKQAAFLRRARWESCHTSDEDNAAAARRLNLFYWREERESSWTKYGHKYITLLIYLNTVTCMCGGSGTYTDFRGAGVKRKKGTNRAHFCILKGQFIVL